MTTIVAHKGLGQMAADRKVTDPDAEMHYKARKLKKVGDSIVGAAGDAPAISRFLKWFETGQKKARPKFEKEDTLYVLVLNPKGLFLYDTSLEVDELEEEFYAVGTGAKVAMGALHAGASPVRAIEIACLVDNSTGPPIDVLELDK